MAIMWAPGLSENFLDFWIPMVWTFRCTDEICTGFSVGVVTE
jgi:hypothetical protein